MNKPELTIKNLRAAVKSLKASTMMHDSGRRHYEKNLQTDGTYSISVSDPILKRYLGEIHPESFIDLAIEMLNEEN